MRYVLGGIRYIVKYLPELNEKMFRLFVVPLQESSPVAQSSFQ
jgi:hypothetical protein